MHVYRGHAAGTKSQLIQTIKHSSGNTSQGLVAAVNFCFVHMERAVAGACIGDARQGQHQIAYIHSQLQPLHVPGTSSRRQILFHTYDWKCGRHVYTELTAGTERIYAHTLATAVIACPRDMYPQGVALCVFFVPHDFTAVFVTATCPAKVHLVELHAACCSNEYCKKDDFYRVNSSGACVCSVTRDLTNHRQQRNGETIISYLSNCNKDIIE